MGLPNHYVSCERAKGDDCPKAKWLGLEFICLQAVGSFVRRYGKWVERETLGGIAEITVKMMSGDPLINDESIVAWDLSADQVEEARTSFARLRE